MTSAEAARKGLSSAAHKIVFQRLAKTMLDPCIELENIVARNTE